MSATIEKGNSEWTKSKCGGVLINGTPECVLDEKTNIRACFCINPLKRFNFEMHYAVAQTVYVNKLYLTKKETEWDPVTFKLFSTGALMNCKPVQGVALRNRFADMVKATEMKHGLNTYATGFEAHPDVTPYDALMIKMIKEITKAKEEAALSKEKKAKIQSSCLSVERTLLPHINMSKKVKTVVNDEGSVVEEGAEDEDGSVQGVEKGLEPRKKRVKFVPTSKRGDTFLQELQVLFPTEKCEVDSPETKLLKSGVAKMKLKLELLEMQQKLDAHAYSGRHGNGSSLSSMYSASSSSTSSSSFYD